MRSPHFIAHEFIKRLGQVGHVAAPDRLRRPRDLEPLPREDVFQSIVRKVIVELAGHDVAQQTRSGQPLVDGRFRLGRRLDLWVLAVDLADRAGVLVPHMMDALEVAREVLDLPALLLADLLALEAAAWTSAFLGAQLVHMRSDRKVFEIRDPAPPLAPLHPSQFFCWFRMRRNVIRVDRFAIQILGKTEQQLRQIAC